MASGIAQIIIAAVQSVDDQYANDPEGNLDDMVAFALMEAQSEYVGAQDLLGHLSTSTDYDSYIDSGTIGNLYASIDAAVQAALAAEKAVLQGS